MGCLFVRRFEVVRVVGDFTTTNDDALADGSQKSEATTSRSSEETKQRSNEATEQSKRCEAAHSKGLWVCFTTVKKW